MCASAFLSALEACRTVKQAFQARYASCLVRHIPNLQALLSYFRSQTQIALCAISKIHCFVRYFDREGTEPVLGTCSQACQIHNPGIPPTSQAGFIINWLIEEDKATIEVYEFETKATTRLLNKSNDGTVGFQKVV